MALKIRIVADGKIEMDIEHVHPCRREEHTHTLPEFLSTALIRRLIRGEDIESYAIEPRHISTRAIKEWHLDEKIVTEPKIADFAVVDRHIATGQIRAYKIWGDSSVAQFFKTDPLPDTCIEVPYPSPLASPPKVWWVNPTSEGVKGYVVKCGDASATSIFLEANISGVVAEVFVWS